VNALRPTTLLLSAWLSACTSAPYLARQCEQEAVRLHNCIPVEQLAEWDSLDDSTLLLWAPGTSRAYLLRLGRPLGDLTLVDDIDIADGDQDRMICPCGRDGVVEGRSGQSARILAIEYLTEQRTAELLRNPPIAL
jgi:hypothetical protein